MTAADNAEQTLASLVNGHMTGQQLRLRVREGGDPDTLIEAALATLAGDAVALRALERQLARDQLVTEH